MNKKYTKKQITEAIAYWENKLNESLLPYDSEGLSRNLENIVARLDDGAQEKFKHDISNLRSLLKDLPSTSATEIPLANQIAQAAVSTFESLLDYQIERSRISEADEYDQDGYDQHGFTHSDTDIYLFDVVDGNGRNRNGNYDHYAVSTDGTVPENEVKKRLDVMAKNWTGNALRNAKREARKRHTEFRSYQIPFNTFKIVNVQHMTKQEYIANGNLGEVRFFGLDD